MQTINANDLKKHGITSCSADETLITVRGRPAFVVLTLERYESLSMADLSFAVAEAQADYEAGRYVVESAEEHVKRITK